MTHEHGSYRKTLSLLYLRQISAGLLIYQPIFIPFLLWRGLNLLEVAYLQTAYNLAVLALDIPAGYFADRFGRKWALAIANSALVVGTALIAVGHSLGVFIIAELFYAVAIAMDAGNHSAYMFEWLRRQGRADEYYRFDAMGTFLFLVVGSAGTFVAGYMAENSLLTPVVITIALTAIGIPAACLLPPQVEAPTDHDTIPEQLPTGNPKTSQVAGAIHKICALSEGSVIRILREVLTEPGLRWALGTTIVWFWSRQYINLMISQPYFKSIGLELRHFGILFSILTLASGAIALFSRRLIQRPDLRAITVLGLVLIPITFAVMGLVQSRLGLIGYFLFAIPYGLCTAVTNTLLNRRFSAHRSRSTFLSIVDFFVRLASSAFVLSLGWVLHSSGAADALLGAALISGLFAIVLLPGAFRYAKGGSPAGKTL